jgi:hypothetical protein
MGSLESSFTLEWIELFLILLVYGFGFMMLAFFFAGIAWILSRL